MVEQKEREPVFIREDANPGDMILGEQRTVNSIIYGCIDRETALCEDCARVAEYIASFTTKARAPRLMASAPKDGTRVILLKGGKPYIGFWQCSEDYAKASRLTGPRFTRSIRFLENAGEAGNWMIQTEGKPIVIEGPEAWRYI